MGNKKQKEIRKVTTQNEKEGLRKRRTNPRTRVCPHPQSKGNIEGRRPNPSKEERGKISRR